MNTQLTNRTKRIERDPVFRLIQEMKIRNFSYKTIKSYIYYNNELIKFARYKSPLEINRQDIRDYLDWLFSSGRSASTVNLAINALRFYYEQILHRKFFISDLGIKRPKIAKSLPIVLSKEEIMSMIEATDNLKHKLMIELLYGSGLRVSELVNLKINDIDFNRRLVIVKSGKGKKDRITIVSEKVLDEIGKYLLEYQPLVYLFEGYNSGRKISDRTIQKVVYLAAEKAKINKNISAHSLRHSFATHQLENNVNLRYTPHLFIINKLCFTYTY